MQECEGFIRDADCTKDTPLTYGEQDASGEDELPLYN